MEDKYTLYMRKGEGAVVDTFSEWGIVCCSVPFKAGGKTKALAKRDWYDEHGEDTFIPANLPMEAYDAEFEFAYKGKELASNPFNLGLAFQCIDRFTKWLSGNDSEEGTGAELSIYSPFSSIGKTGCYLLEINDEEPCVQTAYEAGNVYNENVVTFKAKFRVTEPMSEWVVES